MPALIKKHSGLLLLAGLLIVSMLVRKPFLSVPLERDEGVRATIAQGMLAGGLPYKDFYTNKPPLILILYICAFKLFGVSVEGIHLFLHLYTLVSMVMIFLLVREISRSRLAALVAAFTLSITTISPRVFGNAANLELFMILPIILSALFAYRGFEKNNLFLFLLSGFFTGLAFWIKQPGIFNLFFLLSFVLSEAIFRKTACAVRALQMLLSILGGFAAATLIIVAYFAYHHILADAMLWIFRIGIPYLKHPFYWWSFYSVATDIARENIMLYALSLLALLTLADRRDRAASFLIPWLIFSTLAIIPGFHFIPHYFIQIFPPLAVLVGLGAEELWAQLRGLKRRRLRIALTSAAIALAIVVPLKADYPFLFIYAPDEISRKIYEHRGAIDLFPQTAEIGEYIKRNTAPSDLILVAGNEPQIYFYAQRPSATRHIGFFYLFQNSPSDRPLQESAYEEIEKNRPAYIVMYYSMEIHPGADTYILSRLNELIRARYTLDGFGNFRRFRDNSGQWTIAGQCHLGKQSYGSRDIMRNYPGALIYGTGPQQIFMLLFKRMT